MGESGVVETGDLVFSLKSGPKGSIRGAALCLGVCVLLQNHCGVAQPSYKVYVDFYMGLY